MSQSGSEAKNIVSWQLHYNLDITYLFVPAEEQKCDDTKSPVQILQPYNEPLVCTAAEEDAVGGVKKTPLKLQLAVGVIVFS